MARRAPATRRARRARRRRPGTAGLCAPPPGLAQRLGRGQRRLSRALRRLAWQVACRGIESFQPAATHCLAQRRARALGHLERRLLGGRGYGHQVTHVGSADVPAQLAVELLLGARNRAQALGLPLHGLYRRRNAAAAASATMSAMRSFRAAYVALSTPGAARGHRAHGEPARHQAQQHPARHRRRSGQPGDGEKPKLREPGEAGKSIAPNPTTEVSMPRWARCAGRWCSPLRRARLREQVDRVIHRLADQRDAERDGNAMHRAECEADGRQAASAPLATGSSPRPRTRAERYSASSSAPTSAVPTTDSRHASPWMRLQLVAANTPARRRGPGLGAGRGVRERVADQRERLLLGADLRARRACLRDEQGAASIVGKPQSHVGARPRRRRELGRDAQELAARIGARHALHERAGRRGECARSSRRLSCKPCTEKRSALTAGLSR